MTDVNIVIFDVDGVLLDSLSAHLQVCRDEAKRLGLKIEIPSVEEFRKLVSHGAIISPMAEFFRSVGFPAAQAQVANEDYRREFGQKYHVGLFPGIPNMLAEVAATGIGLGIVTSNTRRNISSALGHALKLFDRRCIFADDDSRRVTKAEALKNCASIRGVKPEAALYVGDQPRDFAAAQLAQVQFLGVTYGWGIEPDETRFPIAHSPNDIAAYIGARRNRHLHETTHSGSNSL
jgi:phosphoglycolate phosphatase-like HAD superfamily hydrolase